MKSQKKREILHSKRGNLQYLEHCRVMVKDGRVLFLQADPGQTDARYWNIPVANTTAVLLGPGTSITQAAVRLMAESGVMLGFCGGGGTPLLASNEIEWISPQSEYRPTEYIQSWMKFWFDDQKRLQVARFFQAKRIEYLQRVWKKDLRLQEYGFDIEEMLLSRALDAHQKYAKKAESVTQLLAAEGRFAKELYRHAANATGQNDFTRDPESMDLANQFLSHGNYLAYGSAATCLWCLGIPHAFAVMHGKTRRGALVFDVADLVKDAIILPLAFIGASEGLLEREFRQECLDALTRHESLDFMFDVVKSAARHGGSVS
ncbi:type I-F CRISPR-associated endonuclease Cas1f [Rosistilla oblonga]|uniref:type I-F CRISPR-associated endonuclease Cas1f n=1 Tax=Rosistilla oblonga TaxID=2527990 RepID=UPI003A96EF74